MIWGKWNNVFHFLLALTVGLGNRHFTFTEMKKKSYQHFPIELPYHLSYICICCITVYLFIMCIHIYIQYDIVFLDQTCDFVTLGNLLVRWIPFPNKINTCFSSNFYSRPHSCRIPRFWSQSSFILQLLFPNSI